jgi:hypothetical protein
LGAPKGLSVGARGTSSLRGERPVSGIEVVTAYAWWQRLSLSTKIVDNHRTGDDMCRATLILVCLLFAVTACDDKQSAEASAEGATVEVKGEEGNVTIKAEGDDGSKADVKSKDGKLVIESRDGKVNIDDGEIEVESADGNVKIKNGKLEVKAADGKSVEVKD